MEKFLVAWDFAKKPSGTFYRVLHSEFGDSHSHGDFELIQRSVALCRDDFTASRLAALADHFGAKVAYFVIQRMDMDGTAQEEARGFVQRVLTQRLHHRRQFPRARTKARNQRR